MTYEERYSILLDVSLGLMPSLHTDEERDWFETCRRDLDEIRSEGHSVSIPIDVVGIDIDEFVEKFGELERGDIEDSYDGTRVKGTLVKDPDRRKFLMKLKSSIAERD